MFKIYVIGAMLCLTSCAPQASWHLAYKNDRDGSPLTGNIDDLVSAVRRGCNIRVAWGGKSPTGGRSIEHISTPKWISIHNDTKVSVQLDEHVINLNDLGKDSIENADTPMMWRVAITTDGDFDAVWYDRISGKLHKRVPQNHIMSWFTDCAPAPASPLYAGGKPRKPKE